MSNDERIAVLETTNKNLVNTLYQIECKLSNLDQDIKSGFKDINNRLWTNFFWTIGGFSGTWVILAHVLKWI